MLKKNLIQIRKLEFKRLQYPTIGTKNDNRLLTPVDR